MNKKTELYQQTASKGESNLADVVKQHAALVKQIAYHLLSRLPSSVQLDDLIQAGMIGLIEAHQRFDISKNVAFEAYASIRIRGTMIDELRRMSWMPRSTHQNMRKVSNAIHEIENRTGHEAQASDIAEVLGINAEEYAEILTTSYANELFSLDDVDETAIIAHHTGSEPELATQKIQLCAQLTAALKTLSKQEQSVLAFYYSEKLKFKEIGEVLGVGEARVCQMHSQGLARLAARMKKI